ncbi:MAG: carbohydrate ABC transporter permease [Lachnospiraceae bacterium]|jgi:multiple sugar transport system permease protein|nr:carbohydrate ABC transporter permease [Lachnospiraceae bacterium]
MRKIWLFLLGAFFITPVFLVLSGTVLSRYELQECLLPLITGADQFIGWKFFPQYPTFEHYLRVLFYTPQFFVVFWNSMKIVVLVLAGQLFLAVPAAWAFAVYRFRFRKVLFTLYVVLMLMPFQVTMLSNYLVLEELHLMNTHGAIIFPAVFSTFPVFLIYRGFCALPDSLIDAARVDGAGEWMIFWKIGLPLASNGILSAVVLNFLEYWNLMEQPLAFLEDQSLWPLSLYLPEIHLDQAGYSFVASVITLIPPVFVFLIGQEYLERGIAASALKE